MKKTHLFYCCVFVFAMGYSQGKKKTYTIRTIAFYNVENLFDTINDPNKNDEASPIMELKGNKSHVYWDKINQLGKVISQIGKEKTNTSPAIIGLAEIENRNVLIDLINSKYLMDKNYQIIHYDSPSFRGIDVALLYQEKYFQPIHHEAIQPNIYKNGKRIYTRDQLWVTGYLDDDLIHLIINHWPSRRGGEESTRPLREKTAYQNTKIIEKIREKKKNSKILLLGDFNDSPNDTSFKEVLKSKGVKSNLQKDDIYNPFEKLHKLGYNTLGYRDNINLFDQILLSTPLVNLGDNDFATYKLFTAHIFSKPFLTTKKGRFKGYPFRSFSYGRYIGGYSDHYPVYVYLIKEKK